MGLGTCLLTLRASQFSDIQNILESNQLNQCQNAQSKYMSVQTTTAIHSSGLF